MYFIAKTPLGQFESVFSDNEADNEIVRQTLTANLDAISRLFFQAKDPNGGEITVSLGPDIIKNSVFIIVD